MISPLLIVLLAAIGLVALGAVTAPLLRRAKAAPESGEFDRAVYRDQLREIELDQARGLLDASETASARLEIERRLLASADRSAPAAPPRRRRFVAGAIVVVCALWAAGLYLVLGAPEVPDMPFAARGVPMDHDVDRASIEAAAAQLSQRLEAQGGDAETWLLLARTETALQHWAQSAAAYRHAIDLAGDAAGPGIRAAYAETLVLAAQGIVTPDAAATFQAVLERDPANQVARFYLALAASQAGHLRQAIDSWLKLAGELEADSDMRAEIGVRVADAARSLGIDPPSLPAPKAADAKP